MSDTNQTCPKCNEVLTEQAKFCPTCGHNLFPSRGEKFLSNYMFLIPVLVPVGCAALMSFLNPSYMAQLIIQERPFIISPWLPCGWLAILVFIGLLGFIYVTMQFANHSRKTRQGMTSFFFVFIASFLAVVAITFVMLAPALFLVLREEVLTP